MSLNTVPIVDVHLDNFRQLWPSILLAIKTSSFIAIDLELSGLGNRKALNASSVEERYSAISHAAKSRSIISIGLSCFKLLDKNTGKAKPSACQMWNYYVQTFNITTLCLQDFIVEPEALKFLISHGFDFNKQYSKGVPYYKGNDKEENNSEPCIRSLLSEILKSNHSLVLHNGLVDLIFMYQCWYADLPSTMASFAADFFEACPGGIYDTKFIAEFFARTSATYLEYVFRKLQRENEVKAAAKRPHVSINFMKYPPDMPFVEYYHLNIDTTGLNTVLPSDICMTYAYHGWCPKAATCPLSHNVDCVLDMEGGKMNRKKRKLPQMQVFGSYPLSKKVKVRNVTDEIKFSKNAKPHRVAPLVASCESAASLQNDGDQNSFVSLLDNAPSTHALNETICPLLFPGNNESKEVAIKSTLVMLASSGVNADDCNQQDISKTSPTRLLVECTSAVSSSKGTSVSSYVKSKPEVGMLGLSESHSSTSFATHHESQSTILETEDSQKPVFSDLSSDEQLLNNKTKHSIIDNQVPSNEVNTANLLEYEQHRDNLFPATQIPARSGIVASTEQEKAEENKESLTNKKKGIALHEKKNTCDPVETRRDKDISRLEQKSRGHRAGCDAFMTGFSLAMFLARYGVKPSKGSLLSPETTCTEEMVNKMYLSGKSVPFLIWKSQYTKTSKQHQEKLLKIHSD